MQFTSMVIEEAAEGNKALRKVSTFLPDLIFMDIKLPGKSGLYLTKKIKKDHPEIIIVILTCTTHGNTETLRLNVGQIALLPRVH